jgi:hypothetical protein
MNGIILIHPPMAKACEPPGGPARLAGALRRQGVFCRIWDANLEGQLALLASAETWGAAENDAWTRRAAKHCRENLSSLRSGTLYSNTDRYRRAVMDLDRLLGSAAKPHGVRLSIADYEADRLSPVRSADLLRAAAEPDTNPFYPWFLERFSAVFAEAPVSHVGFSLNYLSQALTTFAMVGSLRRAYPALQIVLGGGLVTSWMRNPGWENPFSGLVDEMIAGPGEAPLLALLGSTSLDDSGCPDLAGFPATEYLAPGLVLPYSASQGCWWGQCSFCPERAEGNPYRPLPFRLVADDLRTLTKRFHPLVIHLLDDALSPALLEALIVQPPGAPWYGFTRIIPQLTDGEFCRKLKEAGCIMLKLGLESGDQNVLDGLNKGIDLADAARVLKNLKAAWIATYIYLLFGTPAETEQAARKTRDFTAAHADEIGFLNLALFNLPVQASGTEGFETGEFYEGDLSLYRRFVHPQGWHRGEVRRFLEKEFKRQPAIAKILRREPPFFTSNHAPFLVMAAERAGRPHKNRKAVGER